MLIHRELNPGSFEISAAGSKLISVAPLLRTLLHCSFKVKCPVSVRFKMQVQYVTLTHICYVNKGT